MGGLDTLTKLQVLSLGHNQLDDLQGTVLYLHQLPSLETLCLKGNMFSVVPSHEDERMEIEVFRDYQMICLAFLPNLIYLDYQMITDEAVSTLYLIHTLMYICTLYIDVHVYYITLLPYYVHVHNNLICTCTLYIYIHVHVHNTLICTCTLYIYIHVHVHNTLICTCTLHIHVHVHVHNTLICT